MDLHELFYHSESQIKKTYNAEYAKVKLDSFDREGNVYIVVKVKLIDENILKTQPLLLVKLEKLSMQELLLYIDSKLYRPSGWDLERARIYFEKLK